MHHPTDRIIHTTVFVTPVVEYWLEREIAQWVHSMKDRPNDPSHHERTLLPGSYISLPIAVEGYQRSLTFFSHTHLSPPSPLPLVWLLFCCYFLFVWWVFMFVRSCFVCFLFCFFLFCFLWVFWGFFWGGVF